MSISWNEKIKLFASDGGYPDNFGFSVDIYKNYMIAGSYLDSPGTINKAGSAYIFQYDSNSNWNEIKKITANDPSANDNFGTSVSIHEKYALVGAPLKDQSGNNSGAAYIFKNDSNNNWKLVKKLIPNNPEENAEFGNSLSIYGRIAAISCHKKTVSGNDNAGSVYLFKNNGTDNWDQIQELVSGDSASGDNFGHSIKINKNYLIVGSSIDGSARAGAYIFKNNGNDTWTQIKKFTGTSASAEFGKFVSINGDYAICSDRGNASPGYTRNGACYLFKNNNDSWNEIQKITASDLLDYGQFGYSVGIYKNYLAVGAPYASDYACYLFKNINDTWTQISKISTSNPEGGNSFGKLCAISENNLVVGDYTSKKGNTIDVGACYIFNLVGDTNEIPPQVNSADSQNISESDLNIIESVQITINSNDNTKATINNTVTQKIKSIVSAASDESTKNKNRRALLKKVFTQSETIKKISIPTNNLALPKTFTKSEVVVVREGETINVSDLSDNEGIYSVLNNNESITVNFPNANVTFTRNDVNSEERYDVSVSNGKKLSDIKNFNIFTQ